MRAWCCTERGGNAAGQAVVLGGGRSGRVGSLSNNLLFPEGSHSHEKGILHLLVTYWRSLTQCCHKNNGMSMWILERTNHIHTSVPSKLTSSSGKWSLALLLNKPHFAKQKYWFWSQWPIVSPCCINHSLRISSFYLHSLFGKQRCWLHRFTMKSNWDNVLTSRPWW